MEHFMFRPRNFFFGCVFRFLFPVLKLPENWKLPVLEELGIFRHHRRVRHEKWPPMKRCSSLYDVSRKGKRWHYDFVLDFWSRKNNDFAKMILHYEVAKLRTNKEPSILRSWEFLETTGMSAMKHDPQWKDFQVSTTFGGGVKGDITFLFLDFWPKQKFTISRTWCCITTLRNCEKTKNRQFWGAEHF